MRGSHRRNGFTHAQRLDSDPSLFRNRVYRLFDSGRDEALLRDAETFIRLAGWGNESSPYVGFVAALTYWRVKDAPAAEAVLARVAASLDPESWSAAVARFLRGEATPEALLRRARHIGEETEAHAYIGLKAAVFGRLDEALPHLLWVTERGSKGYVEYSLARAELERLKPPTSEPPDKPLELQ